MLHTSELGKAANNRGRLALFEMDFIYRCRCNLHPEEGVLGSFFGMMGSFFEVLGSFFGVLGLFFRVWITDMPQIPSTNI